MGMRTTQQQHADASSRYGMPSALQMPPVGMAPTLPPSRPEATAPGSRPGGGGNMRAQQAQQRHDLLQQLQDLLNPHSDGGPAPTPPASSGRTTPSDTGSAIGGGKDVVAKSVATAVDKPKPDAKQGDDADKDLSK